MLDEWLDRIELRAGIVRFNLMDKLVKETLERILTSKDPKNGG
jgi:hypothetical protein